MKLFFDNNLPPPLAQVARALDESYEAYSFREKFDPKTSDVEWINALAQEKGYVVFSRDRFSKGSAEREAIRKSGLPFLLLLKGWFNLPRNEIVGRI